MLAWKNGQPFSDRFGDVYFSADSGLEETRHVFLQGNSLAERFAALRAGESICIGETGFGTGLNFLCAWQLFEQVAVAGASLDFFSVEKFPLQDDELRAALALWPELHAQAETLLARWHRRVPGWNRWHFANGRVRLTLAINDAGEALSQLPAGGVDAWFLDGFSPAKNPEMWSDAVLANIARASREGATLATYTSAGWVRRGLQQAGFAVEKVPGFGSKREMVRGVLAIGCEVRTGCSPTLNPSPGGRGKPSAAFTSERNSHSLSLRGRAGVGEHFTHTIAPGKTPRTALIIGGGIAGCAAAHALAQRGITVTLIERAAHLATEGSGNPRGILHARYGAGDNPLHRFVLAAYGHALALLDEAVPVDGINRAECGLLQLACSEVESKRIARLAQLEWPAHLMQFVDAAQATQLAGVEMMTGGLWFPGGGWVVPPKVCAALASDARITQLLGHEVETLDKTETGWCASGHDVQGNTWKAEADVVLVCCAHAAKKLAAFAHFPLTAVRGQITIVPQSASSKALRAVVCGDGYCAPAVDGVHVTGATHAFDDESTEIRAGDHAENLAKLAEYAPRLYEALNQSLPPCRGKARMGVEMLGDSTSTSSLTLPLQGGGDAGFGGFAGLVGRASVRCSAPGSMPLVGKVQEGLYCSLAHGTRGLLSAGIAGEVLAAQICGQLPPLPASILAALDPLPRVKNKGKCAT
ncbi:MAG: FAD-dependent 5-carboxymethylaminomethyl-2-thiouridine(34) oxidoreductase MnmC [Sideroxydans sp.]|nr:FAD-dependent 5-carboxymethylaminomethyl-2-thiouridine(34) oxidoreductase MnmC [Sideroxydans sp.]